MHSQMVAAHTFKPSTLEAEAGLSLWVRGQRGLQSEFQDTLQSYVEKPCLKKQNNKQTNPKTTHISFI